MKKDDLPANTLRLILDPASPSGIVRADWMPAEGEACSYAPKIGARIPSLRALAIAFLCVEICRREKKSELEKLATLSISGENNDWRIKPSGTAGAWLQTLGNAFEERNDKTKPLAVLIDELDGFYDETNPGWNAGRTPFFWCRRAQAVPGAHAVGGPNLRFRRDGAAADLNIGGLPTLARDLEASGSWKTKLLNPAPAQDPDIQELCQQLGRVGFQNLIRALVSEKARANGISVISRSDAPDGACRITDGRFVHLAGPTVVNIHWGESAPAQGLEFSKPMADLRTGKSGERLGWDPGAQVNLALAMRVNLSPADVESQKKAAKRHDVTLRFIFPDEWMSWLRVHPVLFARFGTADAASRFSKRRARLSDKLVKPHGDVRLFGFPKSRGRAGSEDYVDPNCFQLPEVFVPQNLTKAGDAGGEFTWKDLFDAPAAGRVLIGGPGAGKTWLLRYLAWQYHAPPSGHGMSPSGRVPLFLSLRDFSNNQTERPTLIEAIAWQSRRDASLEADEIDIGDLKALLDLGDAAVLFDGLDEAGDHLKRGEICRIVNEFRKEYPSCPHWVTSRVVGYDRAPLDSNGFETFHVDPFHPAQQEAFIRTWYDHRLPDVHQAERREAEIGSLLKARADAAPDIREMAGIPLLLTLMAWVHDERGYLPPSRGELYHECIEIFVHRREKAKFAGAPTALEDLDPPIKPEVARRYYATLALRAQELNEDKDREGRGVIPYDFLLERLSTIRGNDLKSRTADEQERKQVARAQAEAFLEFAEERCALLRDVGDGNRAFAHLSFQEFLAAERIPADLRLDPAKIAEFILAKADSDAWRETLLLLFHHQRNSPVPRDDDPDDCMPFADWFMERTADEGGPSYWRLLGMGLRDRLEFSPVHSRRIVDRLLDEWLEAGEFTGEVWKVLEQIARWAERPKEILLPPLEKRWSATEPDEAFAALHLRVRLLGWPTDDGESRRLIGELRARLDVAPDTDSGRALFQRAAELLADGGRREGDCVVFVRSRLEETMTRTEIPPKSRAKAGMALGRLGDSRPGVGLSDDGLPEIAFIDELPAGAFVLAGNKTEVEIERPYRLSVYPVTVAQYQAFIDRGGYRDDGSGEAAARLTRWWGEAGMKWKRDEEIDGPESHGPAFQTPNHPRVGVSWHEANAFCAWLTESLRKAGELGAEETIRLPHEAEWERVARWNKEKGEEDERRFPWGNDEEALSDRCNMNRTGIGHTSAVGLFPDGASDLGAMDMSGNVWEWCGNLYSQDGDRRVLRGGSWGNDGPDILSCSARNYFRPDYRNHYIGFRVVRVVGSARSGASS